MKAVCRFRQRGFQPARTGIYIARLGVFVFISWYLLCSASPRYAYAADAIPRIGDVSQGTCFILDTNNPNTDVFSVSFEDGNLEGIWPLYCMDHTAAAPTGVWAVYTAIVVNVDVTGGTVAYRLYVTPPNATDGHTYLNGRLAGYQHVGGSITIKKDFGGWIKLQKTSSRPDITDANPCYSLERASFGVFSDAACTQHVATLDTDSRGIVRSDILEAGPYWIREMEAPRGYALNPAVQQVLVANGQTSYTFFSDAPQTDPLDWLLIKADGITGQAAQGNGLLKGARFSVRFYPGWFEADALPSTAAGSWTFETDSEGRVHMDTDNLTAGGPFCSDRFGKPVFPLGTVAICEIQAPPGYIADPSMHVVHIVPEGSTETTRTYRTPVLYNTIQRGDVRVVKEAPTTNDEEDQETTRIVLEGVRFQIINESMQSVASPETGQIVPPGQPVCTITTDENGLASTRNSLANGWSMPTDWTGALAYGTYRIHEIIPEHVAERYLEEYGIPLVPVDDFPLGIAREGSYEAPTLVANHIPQTPLRVIKRDAETGMPIPLPCSFQIIDATGKPLAYIDRTEGTVIDTWSTGSDGSVTLPMKLDGGEYQLKETEAPWGYAINDQPVPFTVDVWRTWENPIVVELTDMPVKGIVELHKKDAETGESIAGAEYLVIASHAIATSDGTTRVESGDVVDILVTGEDGLASSVELYPGLYAVRETKAPEDYAVDTQDHDALITPENRTTPHALFRLDLEDRPTTLKMHKFDAVSGASLAGAVFRVWKETSAPGAETTLDTGEAGKVGEAQKTIDSDRSRTLPCDTRIITGDDGSACLGKLAPGTYCIQEIEAPWGYGINDEDVRKFTVDERGLIDGKSEISIDAFDTPASIRTTAIDRASGTHGNIASEESQIVDFVTCEGLIAGCAYSLSGQLMDADTGEPLLFERCTAHKEFIAASAECVVEMNYSFDSRKLDHPAVVVFESLSCDNREVISHADLEDNNQTVVYARPGEAYPQTGNSPTGFLKIIMPLAAIAAASGIYNVLKTRIRRRRACRYTWEQANTPVP